MIWLLFDKFIYIYNLEGKHEVLGAGIRVITTYRNDCTCSPRPIFRKWCNESQMLSCLLGNGKVYTAGGNPWNDESGNLYWLYAAPTTCQERERNLYSLIFYGPLECKGLALSSMPYPPQIMEHREISLNFLEVSSYSVTL